MSSGEWSRLLGDYPISDELSLNSHISKRAVEEDGTPKNVNWTLSFVYISLGVLGYPLLSSPIVIYQVGSIPFFFIWTFYSILSLFTNLLLIDGIMMIPGNEKFELNLEMTGLVKVILGKVAFILFEVVFLAFIFFTNMGYIRITSNVIDDFISLIFGNTYGLLLFPEVKFVEDQSEFFYKGEFTLAITAGYLICSLLFIIISAFQLQGSLLIMGIGLLFVIVSIGEFIAYWSDIGFNKNVLIFNSDWSLVMGNVIFNLGIGYTIPAWINQKKQDVNAKNVLYSASILGWVLNIILPFLAVYVYGSYTTSDLFEIMVKGSNPLLRVSTYVYILVTISSCLPVNTIIAKNNLYSEGIIKNQLLSFCITTTSQYLISWVCLSGGFFEFVMNSNSLIFGIWPGFLFPLFIYYKAQLFSVKRCGYPRSPSKFIPKSLLRYWKVITIGIICFILFPTIAQGIIDIYLMVHTKKK